MQVLGKLFCANLRQNAPNNGFWDDSGLIFAKKMPKFSQKIPKFSKKNMFFSIIICFWGGIYSISA
jgi:hypothetical protein